jgi:hypothetical protein
MKARAPKAGLYEPRPVRVGVSRREPGRPAEVAGRAVESVREEWLVEDRWWTSAPLRRHYLEVVLAGGRCSVVFRDLVDGRWYEQR